MSLMEIYKIFEKRKLTFQELVKNNGHSLALDQKQKIRGAIDEIDMFLKTLEYYHCNETETKQPSLACNPEKKGFLSRFSAISKKK
jgi:hypothetical protein